MDIIEKPIENMEGFFARSDGTIRTPCGIESGFIAKNGYPTIDCGFWYRYVHRLIARTLVVNPCPYVFNTVDHISRDKTDNSKNNLRWCSQAMNCLNREAKNCYWDKRRKRWHAKFRSGNQWKNVGYYDSYEEGHEAAKRGKVRMWTFLLKMARVQNEKLARADFRPQRMRPT